MAQSDLETRVRAMFEATGECRVDRLGSLIDIQREPVWQHLHAMNCTIDWVDADDIADRAAEGWQPVLDRRINGRSTIFMDRADSKLLMYKAPPELEEEI